MKESLQWNLSFGFVDGTIRSFAANNRALFRSRSALVTCIDSSPTPSLSKAWTKLLVNDGVEFELAGSFVWIPARHLARAIEVRGAFPGFDEIYLLQGKPECVAGIAKRFTSDGVTFIEAFPDELGIQMRSIGADGYFSDGCGLNFALESELVKTILQQK